jgi:hypothetical protein
MSPSWLLILSPLPVSSWHVLGLGIHFKSHSRKRLAMVTSPGALRQTAWPPGTNGPRQAVSYVSLCLWVPCSRLGRALVCGGDALRVPKGELSRRGGEGEAT